MNPLIPFRLFIASLMGGLCFGLTAAVAQTDESVDDFAATLDLIVEQAEIADATTGSFDTDFVYGNLLAQNTSNPLSGEAAGSRMVGSDGQNSVEMDDDNQVTLNFEGADISALINLVAKVSGKNFLVDPRVNGKVTLVSGSPVPGEALYDIFLSVLAMYNFAAIPAGNVVKILPANLVKQNPTPTFVNDEVPNNEQEITYIVTLEHASVNELLPIVRPLLPPTAHIAPHAGSNTIILTDRANNIRRILALIHRMDKEQASQEIHIVYLKHANAQKLSGVISQLAGSLNSNDAAQGKPVQQTLVQVDEGLNALILRTNQKDYPIFQALIDQLDVERPEKGNVHVEYLKYAQAKDMVTLLNGIVQDKQASVQDGAAAPSTKISIQADESTNSLVIRAEEDDYMDIKGVIDQLDVRRSQIFLEAIIAEVSESDDSTLGIDWLGTRRNGDNSEVSAGTASALERGNGFSLGFVNKYVRDIAGNVVPDLSLVLNAIRSDSNFNVISTPNLLTLDNEAAEIVVGQEVPFITGRYTSNNTSTNTSTNTDGTTTTGVVNPFQTIERKEVGLSLKITPQINEGGAIHLEIEQEISNVSSAQVAGISDVVTDKRTISAKVLVDDMQIIVLGGLIRDDVQDTYKRVPILGDIPLLGQAFRTKTKTARKTNLMVFLRPTIIRTAEDLDRLTQDRYEFLRTQEEESLPDTRNMMETTLPSLAPYQWPEGGNR